MELKTAPGRSMSVACISGSIKCESTQALEDETCLKLAKLRCLLTGVADQLRGSNVQLWSSCPLVSSQDFT